MKLLILIKYLIFIILSNLFQSLKVFFTSAIEYFNFKKKFKEDLKFINKLWKIKFKFISNDKYVVTDIYDDSCLYCYNFFQNYLYDTL